MPLPTPLAIARARAKLSIGELATKAELTESTLRRIEKGKHEPRLRTQFAIAQVFGLHPRDLWPALWEQEAAS